MLRRNLLFPVAALVAASSVVTMTIMMSVVVVDAFTVSTTSTTTATATISSTLNNLISQRTTRQQQRRRQETSLFVSTDDAAAAAASSSSTTSEDDNIVADYETPEDAIINIKPKAMMRLRELRDKEQKKQDSPAGLVLRMGVRNGGCSGLSYVMDFSSEDKIEEDDVVDEYPTERLKCVVDAKSMLYLYGLELDYSDELIGGGFKFFNPNAEESCGCGSSFGV